MFAKKINAFKHSTEFPAVECRPFFVLGALAYKVKPFQRMDVKRAESCRQFHFSVIFYQSNIRVLLNRGLAEVESIIARFVIEFLSLFA